MTRTAVLALAVAALGCGGLYMGGTASSELPARSEVSAAVRALRVRVLEDMAFVAEGDADPRLNEQMKSAVEAELGRAGLTVVHGRDSRADIDVRLEIRVSVMVTFLRGHLALTAESGDSAVAVGQTSDEFHRGGEFAVIMAGKAVQTLLRSPGLAEFAEKKNPHLVKAPRAQPSAPVETKPSPETVATAKEHFNQGNRHYELGHYQEALNEFEAAYMAVPDPAFLFNIAQCHRKMGHDKEAVGFYKSYLRAAPNAPNRTDVQKRIRELEGGKHS
ncbi:MAG: tetratricopeptide repeat protein [Polyangia bacterium]